MADHVSPPLLRICRHRAIISPVSLDVCLEAAARAGVRNAVMPTESSTSNRGLTPELPDNRGSTPEPTAHSLLRTAFRQFFWLSYDHIGLLILANLLWILLSLPLVTAPAATAGLFYLTARISRREDASLRDLLIGFRLFFKPALMIGLVDAAIAIILWVNVDFYSHLGGRASIPGMLFAGLIIWATAFWVLIHAHLFPLLISGEKGVRSLFRKSALLTLHNPAFTIGITVQSISLTVITAMTGVGLFAVAGALTAVLLTTGHRSILLRYAPEHTPAPLEQRGWRDLWRPWEAGRTGSSRHK